MSLKLKFSFLNRILLLLTYIRQLPNYPHEAGRTPFQILPEQFLGHSGKSNDDCQTIPDPRIHFVCLFVYLFILFNDGHVLHLRSETVVVRRRINMFCMINDAHMILRDECGLSFRDICFTVEEKLRKTLN